MKILLAIVFLSSALLAACQTASDRAGDNAGECEGPYVTGGPTVRC